MKLNVSVNTIPISLGMWKIKEENDEGNIKMFDEKEYKRKYYLEHIDEIKEYKKKYYIEHKDKIKKKSKKYKTEHREYYKEKNKEYYIKYRDELNKRNKQWQKNNPDRVREKMRQWRKKNPDRVRETKRRWHRNNPDRARELSSRWVENNPEKRKQSTKLYYKNNRDKYKQSMKLWYKNNSEKVKEIRKRWRENNPEKIRKTRREWERNMKRTNLKYNLSRKIRDAIYRSLKRGTKDNHWETLVGYTLNDLIKRLKRTMPRGYSWQDYLEGKLHVDHIIPISAFNFDKPEHGDFKRCWALSNLQLLSAKENLIKHNKLEKPFQPSLKF